MSESGRTHSHGNPPVLLVDQPGAETEEFFVQHGLSIGCAESNTIRVEGAGIERIHAKIFRHEPVGFTLSCADSQAAIVLPSGETVRSLPVQPGTRFNIGTASFRCRAGVSARPAQSGDGSWRDCCPRCAEPLEDPVPATAPAGLLEPAG